MNDAIPDPVMSQKISRLEEVSGRIFALAQKDPDKKAQLQKFMNYYLPTALKLLNTYASLSRQAVEGTNITEAKQSIERSMDLLVTAFENQLDKLTAHKKRELAITFGELVYDGQWFSPLRKALSAFVTSTQEHVTGKVRLELYKGNLINAGVWSPYSLYREDIATFAAVSDQYLF